MPRAFLIVPGILQRPDGNDDWADLAVDWIEEHTPHGAQAYEYRCPALFRFVSQPKRIKACSHVLRTNPGHAWSAVGHSNGCRILLEMLNDCPDVRLESLHLIAPAATAHCGRNHLNEIVRRGQVRDVFIYGSNNDRALLLGRWSEIVAGWIGLGYGDLGRHGPVNMTPEARAATQTLWRDEFGHSTWFSPAHFDDTMKLVTR